MSRTVTLLLIDSAGTPLGALPPYQVPVPWWPEVHDVVAGAREPHGLEVTVLRLMAADRPCQPGGAVRYLAELADPTASGGYLPPDLTALETPPAGLDPHPARAAWAMPGGPAASLAWAAAALARAGHRPARPVQQKTWNLSAIWRLDPDGPAAPDQPVAWLKQVPPFFAHEAAVLRWLGQQFPGAAPPLLAAGPQGRLLLGHVPGEDRHGAGLAVRELLATDLHRLQSHAAGDVTALLGAGVPDRRGARLATEIQQALAPHSALLPPVRGLLAELTDRLTAAAGCGLPDTLVHGDMHPGNARVAGEHRVILDWGDAFVGHPAFDILRLGEGLPPAEADALMAGWAARWRATVPGCRPERAVTLLRPVAALRNAAVYARFLAQIEPSEWPYHAEDVPAWLARAAELTS